jgi:hypothetical protein
MHFLGWQFGLTASFTLLQARSFAGGDAGRIADDEIRRWPFGMAEVARMLGMSPPTAYRLPQSGVGLMCAPDSMLNQLTRKPVACDWKNARPAL